MAGHSQFKNIMVRKGAQDRKRGKIFTKIIREIIVAAKTSGGDIATNPRLRTAVLKARAENMPKDKIENAIAKGTGNSDSDNYEAVRYEGYGPFGVAVIIEALTDNRNRTVPEIRTAFTKAGGAMGETGSVAFMFDRVGLLEFDAAISTDDAMLEAAIEAGADNCESSATGHTITSAVENFATMRDTLAKIFGEPRTAKLAWIAKTGTPVSNADVEKFFQFIEALEDNDDVQEVFSNAEIDEHAAQKLSA